MLSEISKTMKDSTSFVRVLYDAETGNRVNSLTQLYDGINLVAASRLREPFKNVNYHLVSKEKFEEAHHKTKPSHPNQYYHDPDPEKFDTEEVDSHHAHNTRFSNYCVNSNQRSSPSSQMVMLNTRESILHAQKFDFRPLTKYVPLFLFAPYRG